MRRFRRLTITRHVSCDMPFCTYISIVFKFFAGDNVVDDRSLTDNIDTSEKKSEDSESSQSESDKVLGDKDAFEVAQKIVSGDSVVDEECDSQEKAMHVDEIQKECKRKRGSNDEDDAVREKKRRT